MKIPEDILEDFVKAVHKIAKLKLILCSSGNLSQRIDDKFMLITSTGAWMERFTKENIAVCKIEDGSPVNNVKPSVEIGFHAGILRERKDVNMVLHFQSPYATAASCIDPPFEDYNVIPEVPYYIGPIKRVPFYPIGK